ncbi:MAG: hypothetical protein K6B70_02805 [Clostridia bacterium]|nr:hypothetical protein [Clostridia bacterium]
MFENLSVLTVFGILKLISLVIWIVFLFVKKHELSRHVVRLITASSLCTLNILLIPECIKADKTYIPYVVLAIIWLLGVAVCSIEIGMAIQSTTNKSKKKNNHQEFNYIREHFSYFDE